MSEGVGQEGQPLDWRSALVVVILLDLDLALWILDFVTLLDLDLALWTLDLVIL